MSKGIDFVGFKIFYYFKILRKRNIKSMVIKLDLYARKQLLKDKLIKSFQGWLAYAIWADSYRVRKRIARVLNHLNKINPEH